MKCLLVIILLWSFNLVLAQEADILLELEQKRSDAIIANNQEIIQAMYDENYHGITAAGKTINKSQFLELTKSNNPHVQFSIEDVKATVYGSTAIVTGKLLSKSKSGTIIGQSRYILVYIKRDDGWKVVESQDTLVIGQ